MDEDITTGASEQATNGPSNFYHQVYALVRQIPRGRVMTYGQVARLLGSPRAARAVGYALRALDEPGVPWQRVINSRGGISDRARHSSVPHQRRLLEAEGIEFGLGGTCDLELYQWNPDPKDSRFQAAKEP